MNSSSRARSLTRNANVASLSSSAACLGSTLGSPDAFTGSSAVSAPLSAALGVSAFSVPPSAGLAALMQAKVTPCAAHALHRLPVCTVMLHLLLRAAPGQHMKTAYACRRP